MIQASKSIVGLVQTNEQTE